MPSVLATIDLGVLASNIDRVRAALPPHFRLLLPVKADAYGHGLEAVAHTAAECGIDALGVARVDEGERIRRIGLRLPILLLAPVLPNEVQRAIELGLSLQVSDPESARDVSRAAKGLRTVAHVQVNVDTGMRRFGVPPERTLDLVRALARTPFLEVEGIFSHLSSADSEAEEDRQFTLGQIRAFRSLLQELDQIGLLPPWRHVANSAAIIQYTSEVTAFPLNMARVATLVLGYPEVDRPWARAVVPVATLTAKVIALKDAAAGERVGYGRGHRAERQERLAILSIGYGSGYSPLFARGGTVELHGRRAPVVGRICLEHTLVDVTEVPGVAVGDDAEILGPGLPADEAARRVGLEVCELLVPALRAADARAYVRDAAMLDEAPLLRSGLSAGLS